MMQLVFNVLLSASVILLIAQSFSIIYYPTKFFHLAHSITITLGAYITFLFGIQFGVPISISILVAILLCAFVGLGVNTLIYAPLMKRSASSLMLLIASLGIYVVFQNIISLVWGDSTKLIRKGNIEIGHNIFGAYITGTQILTILISIILFGGVVSILKYTRWGKNLRAIASNSELALVFGINTVRTINFAFIIGSILAAAAGLLIAFDTDMTPTMGFNLLLYGVVAMIIGGVGSTGSLIWGSLLLATTQQLGAYYIDSRWMDTIAYVILILFLIWKPLGFSGKNLKKIEI
jgi:branched-chain amino acid transport system permease protein